MVSRKDYLVKKKAVRSVFILSLRRVVAQAIQTLAHVILARILFPETFGAYAIIIFYLGIFTLLSDVGLKAALLQKEKEPTKNEVKTIFTTVLFLGFLSSILMWLFSPVFFHFYKEQLGSNGLFYLQITSFALIFLNLELIPSALMERIIKYKKLVIAEILELFILSALTVWFAFLGWGLGSFVWGIILSRLFGIIVYFILQPFDVGMRFDLKELKQFLPFGISYQLNTVITTFYGALAPVVVGGFAGATALGLVGWASGIGALPRALGEIIGRVIFPLGARVQNDKKILGILIERAIETTNIISLPVISTVMALAQPITFIIFTDKWKDGITSLYLLTLQSVFLILISVLTNALLALGYSKQVRNITLVWVFIQWIVTIPLVKAIGFNGYAVGGFVVSGAFVQLFIELRKHVTVKFTQYTIPYLVYSGISGLILFFLSKILPIHTLLQLILYSIISLILYFCLLFIFSRKTIMNVLSSMYSVIKA